MVTTPVAATVVATESAGRAVVGRFAPSPSALLHFGNLRTAVLAWLYARADNGTFLLRVEDATTDVRADHSAVAGAQLAQLDAFGVVSDTPVVYSTRRFALYDAAFERLRADGRAYPCYCTTAEIRAEAEAAAAAPHGPSVAPGYPGTCRRRSPAELKRLAAENDPVWRIAAEGALSTVRDRRRGTLTAPVDDFVIRRRDGGPAYNLSVVVDDIDQGITQVVRGDDLFETTPRQAFLWDLFGAAQPEWVHVPLVRNRDGKRLAKRDHATVPVDGDTDRWWPQLARSLGVAQPDEVRSLGDLAARCAPDDVPAEPWTWDPSDVE